MGRDLLIIAHFCSDFDGKGNNRFNYLGDLLSENQLNIELVTTDFSHNKKMKRGEIVGEFKYKITLLSEPSYQKNVSIKRLYSHYIMGENLKKYLKSRKKPDVIYCAVPSLNVASVAARYAKKNNIRLIIDIQDLWPEAFKLGFRMPVISDILFYPMRRKADNIYTAADEIVAVSQTYADRALEVNKKCMEAHSIFLGTELASFDRLADENKLMDKSEDEIWLAYIGTLGHSYDLTCVIDALKIIHDKGIKNIKFVVMGDGPLKSKFEEHAKEQGIYAKFMGRLNYGKMVGILTVCDIAVNPITKGAAGSIINKHADYAASGLPVLNTQECPEYRKLISDYSAGLNCENNNPADLAEKLSVLCNDKVLRKTMGQNSRRMAEDRFDRKKIYHKIAGIINKTIMFNH